MTTLSKLVSQTMFSFNINSGLFSIVLPQEHGSDFILDLSDDEDLIEFDNLCDLFIDQKIKHVTLESINSALLLDVNIVGNVVATYVTAYNDKPKELVFTIAGYDLTDACDILDKISRVM